MQQYATYPNDIVGLLMNTSWPHLILTPFDTYIVHLWHLMTWHHVTWLWRHLTLTGILPADDVTHTLTITTVLRADCGGTGGIDSLCPSYNRMGQYMHRVKTTNSIWQVPPTWQHVNTLSGMLGGRQLSRTTDWQDFCLCLLINPPSQHSRWSWWTRKSETAS